MAEKSSLYIQSVRHLTEDIIDLRVISEQMTKQAKPGQFLMVGTKSADKLLSRPISICGIDRENHILRMVFRIAGSGTAEIAKLKQGEYVPVLGPLGNGYRTENIKKALLFGGGIGIPPMLALAKELQEKGCEVVTVLGYRNNCLFLAEEFEKYGKVLIATEDGSIGTKGNVLHAVREWEEHAGADTNADVNADTNTDTNANADVGTGILSDISMIYACGPKPMLRGIKQYAGERKLPAQISLEERMACGIGACLGCVCETVKKDSHTNVNNSRVCKDGPVFFAEDVFLD